MADGDRSEYVLLVLLAVGTGSLTCIMLLHLFPEAWGDLGPDPALLLFAAGYAILFLIGWLVHRACHHRHHEHDVACDHYDPLAGIAVNMTASCAHSLQDGLMLGASFLHGAPYGLAALYSTLLHEIPKKLGDYSFLRPRATLPRTLMLLILTAVVTAGTALLIYVAGLSIEEETWLSALLAGGFGYYVWGHMLPDLVHRREELGVRWLPLIISMAGGFAGMSIIMSLLERGH